MRLFLPTAFLFCLICFSGNAQQSVLTTGGSVSANDGTFTYSVGQVVYQVSFGQNNSITEGVQQPYGIYVVWGIENEKEVTLECKISPNPAEDFVTLSIPLTEISGMIGKLSTPEGKRLLDFQISGKETVVPLKSFTSGIYILTVYKENNPVKVFKIVKK
ncbi:MAG: T9SS type A sorting domain-containing protein [Bacteroidota bacterium]|nr:T9SS type A sorting domain-containing protein [Bacteroidota bacterium]